VWSQPSRRPGKSLPRKCVKTLAHVLGGGDEDSAQLVEGGGARLHGAAAFEQEQAQVLAPAASTGKTQALASEQAARSEGRVDEIALPSLALLAARALALVHADACLLQEANEPCPVTARALDREGRQTELLRPAEQEAVSDRRGRDLQAVELDAEHVQSNRDVHLLVRVDADCHRPLHDLASFSSRWSTGPDRAVSGKRRRLLSGHRPAEAKRRRETGRVQGKTDSASIVVGHPAVAPHSQPPIGQSGQQATLRRYTAWLRADFQTFAARLLPGPDHQSASVRQRSRYDTP
jgi:hypothetical protein